MDIDLSINEWPLPYEAQLDSRAGAAIDLIVIHCTELPDLRTAREYGERVLYDSGTGNSGHYYIERDGSIHLFVHPERIAHHTRGYNERAIGIELSNSGRYPNWLDSEHQTMREPYTEAQIAALIALVRALLSEYPALNYIAGHEDLDTRRVPASNDGNQSVRRKLDPGPLFPWPHVLETLPLRRLLPAT